MDRGSPTLDMERELWDRGVPLVAGLDEVGRGAWAGPIVAAAVILPAQTLSLAETLSGVRDSKQLTTEQRDQLSVLVFRHALVGIGWASHHVIDRDGLAHANRLALLRAAYALPQRPQALLIDYFKLPACPLPQQSLPHGDSISLSIAAASIVAKVVRDRWMTVASGRYASYGFEQHKGYGTPAHRAALAAHGICRLHRRSFLPIASIDS